MNQDTFQAIVVGSGLAGLTCVIELVESYGFTKVALVTKGTLFEGAASLWAQGGVAVALGSGDSPALHAQDTLKVGGGLNHTEVVTMLAEQGPGQVLRIIERGAVFDKDSNGDYQFGLEAAHSRRRVLHAKDATGAEMVRALVEYLKKMPQFQEKVQVFERAMAVELVTGGSAEAAATQGLWIHNPEGLRFLAGARVVLASGGAGQVFSYTTNPGAASGDGLALAYRAGAKVRDVEFFQFHPTALDIHDPQIKEKAKSGVDQPAAGPWTSLPLITEAIRGEGAKLVDETGQRFTDELLPRDQVARAIWKHRSLGHRTYLDARHITNFAERFPTVAASCRQCGIDASQDLLPVVPAAHYYMGGVEVDAFGRTTLSGLWACGEVANGGVHGANRLASNSLLEALVFGARVAQDIAAGCQDCPALSLNLDQLQPPNFVTDEPETIAEIRQIMWKNVGLARQEEGLQEAQFSLQRLAESRRNKISPTCNLLLLAQLMTQAALLRRESRGAHYRLDFPQTQADMALHVTLQRNHSPVWTALEPQVAAAVSGAQAGLLAGVL